MEGSSTGKGISFVSSKYLVFGVVGRAVMSMYGFDGPRTWRGVVYDMMAVALMIWFAPVFAARMW